MIMENTGIDYGNGLTNIDHETEIRYGVIHQGEVLQAWADSSEAKYPCEDCERNEDNEGCDDCMDCEPLESTFNSEGYKCQQSADDPDIFILKSPFFTYCQFCSPCAPGAGYLMNWYKFPSFMKGEFIDASAPYASHAYKENAENAGYIRAYCFGYDWYENNKAPYPVFSVETGKLVNP
jgi:hypothetical protein